MATASEYTEEIIENFHKLILNGYKNIQDADRLTSRLKKVDKDDVYIMEDLVDLCEKIRDYIKRLL